MKPGTAKKKIKILETPGVSTVCSELLQIFSKHITGTELSLKDAKHYITLLGSTYNSYIPKKIPTVIQLDIEDAIKEAKHGKKGKRQPKVL